MTSNSDLSPEDVKKAQALAPQLDPDIAGAIAQGNSAVIQAIASGAKTDAEITQTLISMGLTTGLPPGLQQMVNEQMRQNDGKRDPDAARAERTEKLPGGFFGAAAFEAAQREAQAAAEKPAAPFELRLAEAMQTYTANRYSGDYWAKDFAEVMKSDPKVAAEIIHTEQRQNDQNIDKVEKLRKELQESIDAPEKFKRQYANDPVLLGHMEEIDKGGDPFERFCMSPDAEDALIKYKSLKIDAEETRIMMGEDNNGPDDRKKNPAIKLLEKQKALLQQLDKANDNPTDGLERARIAKEYGEFVRSNRAFLEALENGDVRAAMKIAAEQDRKATGVQLHADHSGDKAQVEAIKTEESTKKESRAGADNTLVAAADKPQEQDAYGDQPEPPPRYSINCTNLTNSGLNQLCAPQASEAPKLAASDPAPEPPADPHQSQKPAGNGPKTGGTLT